MRNPKHVIIDNQHSLINRSTTPLGIAGTFNGQYEGRDHFTSLVVACRTDKTGVLSVYFSDDGIIDDSILDFKVEASTNDVHRVAITRRFYKIVFVNTSGEAQTIFRLSSFTSQQALLNAPKNADIQQDADALFVRPSNYETEIVLGKYVGHSLVSKFGRNPDIDAATVPADIWSGGGVYPGFPTGAPEEIQVVSSNAGDTGVLTFTYLASINSTAYQTANVTLNGITPVNTGITAYRIHTANYNTGVGTTFNLGVITVRHRTIIANVFCAIQIGRSQSTTAAYTVPAGSTAVIKRIFASIIQGSNANIEAALWVRANGASPRLRRGFSISNSGPYVDQLYGGIAIAEKSDIIIRAVFANANNIDASAGYDIELIKN